MQLWYCFPALSCLLLAWKIICNKQQLPRFVGPMQSHFLLVLQDLQRQIAGDKQLMHDLKTKVAHLEKEIKGVQGELDKKDKYAASLVAYCSSLCMFAGYLLSAVGWQVSAPGNCKIACHSSLT